MVHHASAQKPMETTDAFTIEGLVKKNLVITLDSLKNIRLPQLTVLLLPIIWARGNRHRKTSK
jgi:hypothetical protein